VLGAAIGVPFALLTGKALASILYGLKPDDLGSMALTLAGIALVAIGASLIPARRAAGIDPLTALRWD
jgi:ABC-type antimicrobial peptide transport system permease subunit